MFSVCQALFHVPTCVHLLPRTSPLYCTGWNLQEEGYPSQLGSTQWRWDQTLAPKSGVDSSAARTSFHLHSSPLSEVLCLFTLSRRGISWACANFLKFNLWGYLGNFHLSDGKHLTQCLIPLWVLASGGATGPAPTCFLVPVTRGRSAPPDGPSGPRTALGFAEPSVAS